jgi:hypothetical protein
MPGGRRPSDKVNVSRDRMYRASPSTPGQVVPGNPETESFNAIVQELHARTAELKPGWFVPMRGEELQNNNFVVYRNMNGGRSIQREDDMWSGRKTGVYFDPSGTCYCNGSPTTPEQLAGGYKTIVRIALGRVITNELTGAMQAVKPPT